MAQTARITLHTVAQTQNCTLDTVEMNELDLAAHSLTVAPAFGGDTLANPISKDSLATIEEQLQYLKHLFTQLSKDAMETKSAETKVALLDAALRAQSNYVKTTQLCLKLRALGNKPVVYERWL